MANITREPAIAKISQKKIEEMKQFASELMMAKHKASTLGLYKTMHALEPATQAVGWEIADFIEGKRKV